MTAYIINRQVNMLFKYQLTFNVSEITMEQNLLHNSRLRETGLNLSEEVMWRVESFHLLSQVYIQTLMSNLLI